MAISREFEVSLLLNLKISASSTQENVPAALIVREELWFPRYPPLEENLQP